MKNGGLAFPAEGPSEGQFENQGMSLRDWFAGMALSGFATQNDGGDSAYAKIAYRLADAMIAERDKEAG